ncbi:MAG: F0F1 ATP synthase subunit delta, partial [Chlorobi bacterium]|nr:F0F1 ATP synthase subunit delta [Chlorobiota bacterium]
MILSTSFQGIDRNLTSMTSRLARRYASALYASAREAGALDVFLSDLQSLQSMLARSHELMLFFLSPVISREKKKSTIAALFDTVLSAFTVKALSYL